MIKRLIPFAKKYKKAFILAFLCVVGETVFELVIPVLMANIIDIGVAQKDQHYIIMQGVLMAVCALIALVLGILFSLYKPPSICGWKYITLPSVPNPWT